MTDQERLEKASVQALALSHALDHLSDVISSIPADDLFEVIAVQIMTVAANSEVRDINTADVVKIVNRIKTYTDRALILQLIFSGLVSVSWDNNSGDLVYTLTNEGKAKADDILKKIGCKT